MNAGNRIQQQKAHKTRERNLKIYHYCKQNSYVHVRRGVFAKLARELKLTRQRVRDIYKMMRLETEGNNG